ncbi:heat-stable 19 kDa antigen [Aspergillus fumigatus]
MSIEFLVPWRWDHMELNSKHQMDPMEADLILRKTKSSITMKVPTITAAILSSVVPASPGVVAETLKYNRDYDHAQNPELALFSCPDGANGLMTRCRGNNLQQLRNKLQAGTYVGASPAITKWNDLNCGRFLRATISRNSRVVTGEEGFRLLCPSGTTSEGTPIVNITELSSQSC